MKQYIDKDALVAEIENEINKIDLNSIGDWRYRLQREHDIEVMKNIISFINTLEVKEADLEKEILNYIDKATGCKRWITCLKKQEFIKKEYTFKAIPRLLEMIQPTDRAKLYCQKLIDSLEQEGYSTDAKIVKNRLKIMNGEKVAMATMDEQKPDDKAKPKFHEGDWCIDNEDGTIFQIVKVLDKTYKYRTNEGKEYSCSHYSLELDARLWNIQDAKDGDVLTAYECLVLFREIDGLNIRCYCTYHFMNNPSFYVYTLQNKDAFQPATKEQRNQLEKSMADAGYAFDFDKKELKKIEDEEYDGDDYGIDSLWHARHILKKTLGKVDGCQSDDGILEHKCAISAVDRLYKHSIAWSEEDEHWLQKVIDFMNHPDLIKATPTLAKDTINWLKSLKEIVQPQSKQEWSEEDESNFQGIIDVIKENKHHATDYEHMTYYKLLSWFKSLKERYVWKPSNEQMKALDWALSLAKNCGDECAFDLRTLQEQLKKL